MNAARVSASKEDYLKAIAEAQSEGQTVVSATLVHWLKVSAPAASMALKRLRRDRLIEVDRRGVVSLTGAGREIANRLLRRHHLLELMLVDVFDFEWFKVHEEAERMEHAISDDFEQKLAERFGAEAAICPHGNSLGLDTTETRRTRGWMPLSECAPGATAQVRSVYERDRSLLEHLDKLGLRPGTTVTVTAKNWDDTLTLTAGGRDAVLGMRAAELIWVEPRP